MNSSLVVFTTVWARERRPFWLSRHCGRLSIPTSNSNELNQIHATVRAFAVLCCQIFGSNILGDTLVSRARLGPKIVIHADKKNSFDKKFATMDL